jgi:hypothetical protein
VRGCSQFDNPSPATTLMPPATYHLNDRTAEDTARALFALGVAPVHLDEPAFGSAATHCLAFERFRGLAGLARTVL